MKILLHVCCGPCATVALDRLLDEGDVTVFYYNPNIYPIAEWQKRKENVEKLIKLLSKDIGKKIDFICPDYEADRFYAIINSNSEFAKMPEGGARCTECFRERLVKTAEWAKKNGFDAFCTSLTVSPHKNSKLINQIGNECGKKNDIVFLERDFKKQNGFYNSILLSKKYDLYRQNYCGCEFSLCDREEYEKLKNSVKIDI